MAPLLRHEHVHRSSNPTNVPINLHKKISLDAPDSQIIHYLNQVGFQHVASLGKFKINPSLVTAMVERWRPETHTFHLPIGECTITLQDVALQLKYLPLLENIKQVSKYSWGSACLATLYREMCRTYTPSSASMGGCTLLLQSWVWYRMPFLAPRVSRSIEWPLAKRWVGWGLSFTNTPCTLEIIRSAIDPMTVEEFKWLPYQEIHANLPSKALKDSSIWSAKTVLVCFHIVEWHQTDRVKMQFGLFQDIPLQPENLDKLHNLDMRGNADENWIVRHDRFIQSWNDKERGVLMGESLQGMPVNTQEYMMWLITNSKLYLSSNQQLRDPRGGGAVNDQEEAPTRPTTQSQHHRCSRQASPTPPTFEESEEPMPHRHSVSFPPTHQHYEVANQSVQYTPFQDHHRYSTANYSQDFLAPLFSPDFHTPEPYRYYQSILQSRPTWNPDQAGASSSTWHHDQTGGNSSTWHQYEQTPTPIPATTEEEISVQRPIRNRRPAPTEEQIPV